MSDGLLLDTHVVLWLDGGALRLKPGTRDLIDECWLRNGTLFVSAVSIWEIAQHVHRGTVRFDATVADWMDRFRSRPGIELTPLTPSAAARTYDLHHFDRRDPADRMLVATAIELGCPLVTYDEAILRFGREHGSRYGFSVLD